jgi:hypothetical protein
VQPQVQPDPGVPDSVARQLPAVHSAHRTTPPTGTPGAIAYFTACLHPWASAALAGVPLRCPVRPVGPVGCRSGTHCRARPAIGPCRLATMARMPLVFVPGRGRHLGAGLSGGPGLPRGTPAGSSGRRACLAGRSSGTQARNPASVRRGQGQASSHSSSPPTMASGVTSSSRAAG